MLITLFWIVLVLVFCCCCIPALLLPRAVLRKLRVPVTEPIVFVRLFGAANLALCIHYLLGIARVRAGHDPSDIVVIGLVHCGMSAAVIWRYALHGHYRRWPKITQFYVYTSGGLFTVLALALLFAGLWHG